MRGSDVTPLDNKLTGILPDAPGGLMVIMPEHKLAERRMADSPASAQGKR